MLLITDDQDADFDGAEPSSKKRKKNKKGKNKAVEREEVDEAEDDNLTVAEKAKKVKKAMEEYKALDHEDMVSSLMLHILTKLMYRSVTCPLDSSILARNLPHSVSPPPRSSWRQIKN